MKLTLHADTAALLEEIAADPNSSLLRTPRAEYLPDLFRPPELLRPSATFLSRAERHLVAVHREEVAEWLRIGVAVGTLRTETLRGAAFARFPLDSRLWRERARQLATSDLESPIPRSWLGPHLEWPDDPVQLFQASLLSGRLIDHASVPLSQAILKVGSGEVYTATRLFEQVVRRYAGTSLAYLPHMWRGAIAWRAGEYGLAAEHYGTALRLAPEHDYCLAAAALCGALRGGIDARVHSQVERLRGSPGLREYLASLPRRGAQSIDALREQLLRSRSRPVHEVLELFQ